MLKAAGVERLFGMPGGGSNADLIEAAGNAGLPFSLAHTETASAFMAAAQAEITGKPGACLATLGPGAASLMNGVANASLDRVPLLVLTDCLGEHDAGVMRHQALRHGEMFRPVVKWSARPGAGELEAALDRALAEVRSLPPGPVHLDLSADVTGALWRGHSCLPCPRSSGHFSPCHLERLPNSHHPVILAGLGARTTAIAKSLRELCERLCIPALVTYKAKGVIPDGHPWFAGVLTNAALERNVLERADLFLAVGLDPVELIPRPWTHPQPLISISAWPMEPSQLPVTLELVGEIPALLDELSAGLPASQWDAAELRALAEDQRRRMRDAPGAEHGRQLLPQRIVEVAAEIYPGARAIVDAGAHMFAVMSLWPAREPASVLVSNGLSTMGFALPAAIGAALLDPSRPVVVFTGDGGLMMCAGELATAAREKLRLRIIVFQDNSLSLIKVKQEQRGYRTGGVTFGDINWPCVASGFGVEGRLAADEDQLRSCLEETAGHPGPVLIAARISGETYGHTIRALRG